ncbi:hypothetical protein [Terricaulis sp.]|uniref:hypothetical protein n=1 Tax=Terricaulis sp. TaxID=2768686 RepID=UPI00378352BD
MTPAEKKALKALCGKRTKPELKKLFALVRAHNDRALMAAIAPPKTRAAKRRGDPLVREVDQTLKPILGPAAEKAELLVEHMAKKHRRKLGAPARGIAGTVRDLRAKFSEAQIRAGAKSLLADLAAQYSSRETVV